ncbi:hypothetical protein NDU88_002414 [Pleurodeles waltl]|uniref:Uncharacterized protein n=1 Tax=Pleurodeles waltl TaxID=8319 RepID=A0AAV7UB67_PLEWA|nr:hypothetical protein NDU88_002414 [Pleurodeles waltl]
MRRGYNTLAGHMGAGDTPVLFGAPWLPGRPRRSDLRGCGAGRALEPGRGGGARMKEKTSGAGAPAPRG